MSEILFARLDELNAAVANLQSQISAISPIDNPNIIALSLLDSSVGLLTQTAAATFTKRVLTGTAAEITVTNGNGVAGVPTFSLPSAITLTGKTLTDGTFVNPALGTPASGIATNLTGTASGLTAGHVTTNANLTGEVTSVGNAATLTNSAVIGKVLTGYVSGAGVVAATDSLLAAIQKLNGNDATNANLTGVITSVGNATSIASQTGTGSKFVVDTSPTLVTPILGVAAATSINKVAITAPTTSATLTLIDGTTLTGPAASGTAMTLGNVETITGAKTFNNAKLILAGSSSGSTTLNATAIASGVLTLPAATDTLVGKATTDTFTNKTFDTGGTGNSFSIAGTAITSVTGTGANVLAASPALSGTPTTPTATVGTNTTQIASTAFVLANAASAGVASIAGNTGAFTLGAGLTNSVNVLKVLAGQVPGEPSNSDATAGNAGEYISASSLSTAISSGVSTNLTGGSITLSAGDWDVMGYFNISGTGTTTFQQAIGSSSATSATLDTTVGRAGTFVIGNFTAFFNIPVWSSSRFKLTTSTTIFPVVNATFLASTASATSFLQARRAR